MIKIPLTQNQFALIDDEDLPLIKKRMWYAVKHKTFYAASHNGGKKKLTKMHRYLLGLDGTYLPFVDHINHNTLDNRRCNLRVCTSQQNNMNAKKSKGLWPYKGVSHDPRKNYWYARIRYNNKLHHLGTFLDIRDAAQAYNQAAKEYFGEFACLNDLTS